MRRNTRIGAIAATAAIALTALAIGACGGGGSATTTAPKPGGVKGATVGLAKEGTPGKTLVAPRGRWLSLSRKDIGTTSECPGACAAAGPPLRVPGKPVVGTAVSASKIGTTAR